MYKDYKGGDVLKKISILVAFVVILVFFTNVYSSQLDEASIEEIDRSIVDLNVEELKILDELYIIQQDINDLENQERRIVLEIESVLLLIEDIEENIEEKTYSYNNNLEIMESVLKSYQKNGAYNYLQLILSSNDLPTLLRRINSIRDISRNTSKLLDTLNLEKEELMIQKSNLDENLVILDNTRKELEKTISNKMESKATLEFRLNELMDEKDKYLGYLEELNNRWKVSKPVFEDVITKLVAIVETGDLPEELIETRITLTGVFGRISDNSLNIALKEKNLSSPLQVKFKKDEMTLMLDELKLIINGDLEQIDDQSLRFNMTSGQYMGLKLEKSSLEELFEFGFLELKFSSILGRNKIRSVRINDGYLELNIIPVLF